MEDAKEWEQESECAHQAADLVECCANSFGPEADMEYLVNRTSTMHRTLVQSFAGRFVIPFVRELARMYRCGYYDGRNEEACKACLCMCEALEAKYGIKEGEPLGLAFI